MIHEHCEEGFNTGSDWRGSFERSLMVSIQVFLFGLLSVSLAATPFKDVPESHWASKSVDRMVQMGLTSGYQDGTFKGLKSVTRFELALYLSNLSHYMDKQIQTSIQAFPESKSFLQTQSQVAELEKTVADLQNQIAQLKDDLQKLKQK